MSNDRWRDAVASDVNGCNFISARFRNSHTNKWLVDKLHGCYFINGVTLWLDSFGHVWDECQVPC